MYETDADRRCLNVVLNVHPRFIDDVSSSGTSVPDMGQTDDNLKRIMIACLEKKGCMTSKELCTGIGYKAVNARFRRLLSELMDEGRVEYLYPNPGAAVRGHV